MAFDAQADRLAKEASAAKDLLSGLGSDDADVNHDIIEGETSLLEAIDAALSEIDDCDVIVSGCKDLEDRIAARRIKAEKRRDRVRGLIEQALVISGLDGARRPTATLSVRKINPKPIVTDESMLPSDFWKQPDPVLDRSKIKTADATTPGISMSNGGTSLQIRRA